jgi:holo-[acyl-carrier-protein] synthase
MTAAGVARSSRPTVRVGIDIASVQLVRESIDVHGERYLQRVFTDRELAACRRPEPDPRLLAILVAAKEATFKALRVDDRPVAWTDVEVRGASSTRPRLSLRGGAANLARDAGVDGLALALTGKKGASVAAVVIARISSQRDDGTPMNEKIRRAIAEHARLPVDVAELADDTDLYQAGMTSQASVNVMLALEDAFDIEFPDRMLTRSVFESINSISAALTELDVDVAA